MKMEGNVSGQAESTGSEWEKVASLDVQLYSYKSKRIYTMI